MKAIPNFNFNFSTDVLFKCISSNYANGFINGIIKFSKPSVWIDIGKTNNSGQGDLLEGTFYCTDINNNSDFVNGLKANNKIESFILNDKIYFRNKDSINLYCCCLYGLHSNMYNNKDVDRFNISHYYAKVKKEYFDDFSININQNNSVIFILNPHLFFERIINFFEKLDVSKDDIIISPVKYMDKSNYFSLFLPKPYELLTKNSLYNLQSEVRIIINSNSKKYLEYMDKNNGIIHMDSIKDITNIEDNYSHDLLLEKRENSLYYTLPNPKFTRLDSFTLRDLLTTYKTVIDDRLPDHLNEEEQESLMKEIERIVDKKYNFILSYQDGQVTLSNVTCKLEDILDK